LTLETAWKCLPVGALFLAPALAAATASLDNPVAGAAASGVGIISGFHCSASRIDIQIDDDAPMRAGQGTTRPDTAQVCGHSNSGFGLTYNWGRLTPGSHTIRALADGVEFARKTFTVATYGAEFLTGRAAATTVYDFPAPGQGAVLEWQEASQSFVMRQLLASIPYIGGRWNGADLESRMNCASAQNNGNHGTYAQFDITASETVFNIQQTGITGLNCTYTGNFRPGVSPREASGSYSCSDGKKGDFTARDFQVGPNQMSMKLAIQLDTTETCSIEANLGGLRY
jgi:hypothetical protein